MFFILVGGFFSVSEVNAETNASGCNDGDIVTIRFGQENSNSEIQELEVEVGGEGKVGNNFHVIIRCEGDRYKFSDIKLGGNSGNLGTANTLSTEDMSEDGSKMLSDGTATTARVHFSDGTDDYFFWMVEVEQNEETTNPETGVADNAYDPTKTEEQNIKDGKATQEDITLNIKPESACKNVAAAKGLGWIICPILEWVGESATGLYDNAVEPLLRIDPKLFNNNETNNTVEGAWGTFRNIANIIFIILFLVVIFSQLTGVGIDNYGIKKILPRLIVVAILINLSYWICVFLVDISNILGNGFRAIFDFLGNDIHPTLVMNGAEGDVFSNGHETASVTGAIAGVSVLGLLAGGAGAVIFGTAATLLSLFAGAIGVIVGIFFLFLLLSMREAAIVVLIILSPLAMVVYMLPNTKKLFDKWWKFLEGLLLVYPIAGLLVGAGNYVSKLLLNLNPSDFFSWITAMVVGIIPIFFIPMVLKGAFSAMGKIGGALAGMGATATGKAKGYARSGGAVVGKKIAGTDAYRGISNAIGRHALTKRRRAKAVQDTAALMKEQKQRERLANKDNMATRFQSIAAAEDAKAIDEETSQRLSLMQSPGDDGGIIMNNGRRAAFTVDNAAARMSELEAAARNSSLTIAQKQELSALAKGMADMKGGAGAMGNIIRNSTSADGKGANKAFMDAMGDIYTRDSSVRTKMNEKDAGAAAYTEMFMRGSDNKVTDSKGDKVDVGDFNSYKGTAEYNTQMSKKVKTHEAGLNQGGTGAADYIESLDEKQVQDIMDNKILLDSIDKGVRKQFEDYAAGRASTETVKDANGNDVPKYDYTNAHSGWAVTERSANTVKFGDGSKEMGALNQTASATSQTAVNTHQISNDTSRIGDSNEQIVLNTRQSAINTGQTAINTGVAANKLDTTNTELGNINKNTQPQRVERATYDNISGKSSMVLTKMSDGTLRDDSGNVYDQGRWKKAP